ncbi:FAD-dependent monooxygenase [Candidimonas nitroreducens]|nr:FAD-dependent monooxygenase [Candidimonas nitroreducens]
MKELETDVLIVGGGPVGLALSLELGWRGVRCVLVEQTDGVIEQPKMDGVNIRTMEFCRRWGIVDAMKHCDFPKDYPQDMVYLTSVAGYELGREAFATPSGGAEELQSGHSPESRIRCPQTMFDPILQAKARTFGTVSLKYEHRMLGFEEVGSAVVARVQDLRARQDVAIRARYLVACDGGGSGVRKALGAEDDAGNVLTYSTNVMFRCPDIYKIYNKPLAYRHFFIGEEGTWASMVAISGRDVWRLSITDIGQSGKLTSEQVRAAIRRALGAEVPFEVISVMPWARREMVARRFRQGRVFLAGDAAHVMSPTGGFGMNTGIADAVDLAWKLEGALRGWGGEGLLQSYESERRQIALRTVREATGNLMRTLSPGSQPRLLDATREGAIVRYEVGRRFAATMLREWYKLGVDLGYRYAGSPICAQAESKTDRSKPEPRPGIAAGLATHFADGSPVTPTALRERQRLGVHLAQGVVPEPQDTELAASEVMVFPYYAQVGARAPHVWLSDGRSTLDLFGRAFTLFVIESRPRTVEALAAAARAVGLPLDVVECHEPQLRGPYLTSLVLVRPDQHIAWMGEELGAGDAESLIDKVRGA